MKKIVKKLILFIFLLILFLINTFAPIKNSRFDVSSSNYSLDNKKDYARNFLNLIVYADYESAYDMLTDECKSELAGNDLEKFKDIMSTYIYEYGKISKTFYYEEPVECATEDNTKIYSQQVSIEHRSFGSMVVDLDSFGYDINEYTKYSTINFIIYELKPYDYKMSIQLVE